MMGPILMDLRFFLDRSPAELERAQTSMLWLLEALVRINVEYLRYYPKTPLLYDSKVRYRMDEPHGEDWQDIYRTLRKGFGDCEDLACWRCAEYVRDGVDAHPFIRWRDIANSRKYHCLVVLPNNDIEDPSIAMGMRGTVYRKPIIVGKYHADTKT